MGTPNDQAVLQAILNPETPFGDVIGLDLEEAEKEGDEDGVFPQAQLEQSKALELQGVRAAEAGDLHTALERFGQAICLLPERASAYNNRAQARRLQGDVAAARRRVVNCSYGLGLGCPHPADLHHLSPPLRAGALEDLERAVTLSGGRGRAARQSFVQRGLLARLQGRDDDARRDFEQAARLGSPFARRQLVLLNPYAALCNRMLTDMMGAERGRGIMGRGNRDPTRTQ
ncbi:tetratricopeptide repeat protein 36 [Sigmodon hispidus]